MVSPLALSRPVVKDASFLQFKKATASLGFLRKTASVVNPMVLFILSLKRDLVQKVYNYSKTCFSGYDDLNVCTFFPIICPALTLQPSDNVRKYVHYD